MRCEDNDDTVATVAGAGAVAVRMCDLLGLSIVPEI